MENIKTNTNIRREERSQLNNINSNSRNLKKKRKINPKQKKENKTRNNEVENRKTID